jgi:hypothetical protein
MVVFNATIRAQGNQQTANEAVMLFPTGLPTGKYHVWFLGSEGQTTDTLGTGNGYMGMRELQGPTNLVCRDYSKASIIAGTIPTFTFANYTENDAVMGMVASRGEMRCNFTAGLNRVGGWYMGIWDITGQANMWFHGTYAQFLRNGVVYFQAYKAE